MSTENVSPVLNLEKCTVILLDVAGTTTSHSFVKDTLLSFVTKQAEEYLKTNWEDSSVKDAIKTLKDETLDLASASALLKELSEKNDDNAGLKSIQGLIYKTGYDSGDLKAHVFSEVPSCLESWAKNRKIAIFSTGSVESQKLLFSHTTEGDISAHISKYFDQSIGKKTEASSYEKIAKEMEVKPEEILFITDSVSEAKAAKTAGFVTTVVTREGNEELPEGAVKEYSVISSFNDIVFEKAAKRKNEEAVATEEQPPSKVAKTEEGKPAEEKPAEKEPAESAAKSAERIEDEAMEVDVQEKPEGKSGEPAISEKAVETAEKTVEKTAKPVEPNETEKPTGSVPAPEKTDEKAAEPKTEEKTEKPQTVAEPTAASKMECEEIAEKTVVEEKKVEDKEQEQSKEDTSKEELKAAETTEQKETVVKKEKDCDKPVEEVKTVEDKVADEKEETIEKSEVELKNQEENKPEEEKVAGSKPVTEKAKVEKTELLIEEKKVEEPKPGATEVEEPKVGTDEEETKPKPVEESKTEKENSIVAEESKPVVEENKPAVEGTKTPVENGIEKTEEKEVVEKENKSNMANGIEKETTNGVTEEEKKNGDKTEESPSSVEEIKVKKIEEPSAESSPPVSVEV